MTDIEPNGIAVMRTFARVLLLVFFPFKTQKLVLEIPANDKKKDWKSKLVWATFIITILLWATEQLHHISSNVVALIPLAVFTATGLFGKEEIKEINWSVLWLVAGGFALGYLLQDTGLAKVLITAIPFGSMSFLSLAGISSTSFLVLNGKNTRRRIHARRIMMIT